MKLFETFIRNPVKVAVGVLLVALFGVIGAMQMPMQLAPEVETPTITVETRWPGASPQEIEREIVQEQEEQLKSVEGVIKMSSECNDSQGRITLEFKAGTDMQRTMLLVNTRLQQVREYPEDAQQPVINTTNTADRPIAFFIFRPRVPSPGTIADFQAKNPALKDALEPARIAGSSGLRAARLRDAAAKHPEVKELLPPETDVSTWLRFAEDEIEARFERVPGVANAEINGGRDDEIRIVTDPQKLAARGITIADLRNALRARNKDTSGGDYWEGKRRYIVRTVGQYKSLEEIENTLVVNDGINKVYVRDVATVERSNRKSAGIVRHFGVSAMSIRCVRDADANVMEVMEGLRKARAEIDKKLEPLGMQLEQVYDETDYINDAVNLVRTNILIGGLLTIAVLLLFLRSGRSTLVLALAIPTSIIGTFLTMAMLGRTLNVISLAGLAFAVGMLVDNAVVVLENIYRHRQLGLSSWDAAKRGAGEVIGAVVSSTMTTLAVFLPVIFVKEEAGQLFRDIALAISAAVGLSLIVAMTVIPVAASRLLKRAVAMPGQAENAGAPRGPIRKVFDVVLLPLTLLGRTVGGGAIAFNAWLQRGVIRRVVTVVVFVSAALGASWLMFPKVDYLPNGNRNLIIGNLFPPPAYNIDELLSLGFEVEKRLKPYWDVDSRPGADAESEYPAIADFFFIARDRSVFIGLRAADPERAAELVPLIRKAMAGIPGTYGSANQSGLFGRGLGSSRTIDVEITGPDIEKLVALGGRVISEAGRLVPNSQNVPKPSLDLSAPEVQVIPKWEQAKVLGFTSGDLGYAVDVMVDGAFAADYYAGGKKMDIRIVGQEQYAKRGEQLQDLPLATPGGELVPLSAVAEVKLSSGPEQINRRERQRAITIQVTPPADIALEEAMNRIETQLVPKLMQEGALDGGYSINLSGAADKLRATWSAMYFSLVLALLITYLLLAALYESWFYPFVVILSVPLGAAGGLLGLTVLNLHVQQSLDILTMLGFVILIGTVVNNPILIVDQALQHIRDGGMKPGEAVVEAVKNRVRPIFMTTTTTMFGLMPLVVFPGAGSELYRGLGAVLLGGLLISTLVTLVIVPSAFTLAVGVRDGLGRLLTFGKRGVN